MSRKKAFSKQLYNIKNLISEIVQLNISRIIFEMYNLYLIVLNAFQLITCKVSVDAQFVVFQIITCKIVSLCL